MRGHGAAVLIVFAALGGVVIACQEPAPGRSTIACDDQGKACPETVAKPAPGKKTDLQLTPVKVGDRSDAGGDSDGGDAGATETADAGAAEPEGPLQGPVGPLCHALQDCCASLRGAGFNGSAADCDRSVAGLNETTCSTDHELYKTATDSYEPVCF